MTLTTSQIKTYILEKLPGYLDDADCNTRDNYQVESVVSDMFNDWDYHDWTIHSGADKTVIAFDDADFVVKITTSGKHKEVEFYLDAQVEGISEFFARAFEPFMVGSLFCYFQEKVDMSVLAEKDASGINDIRLSEEEKSIAGELTNGVDGDHRIISALVSTQPDKALTLIEFLASHDINDIHSQNYTFDGQHVVIFDYCGHHTDNYSDDSYSYSCSCTACRYGND